MNPNVHGNNLEISQKKEPLVRIHAHFKNAKILHDNRGEMKRSELWKDADTERVNPGVRQ